mmetsp:Transcript_178609/g.572539  ORF Transcript_178609/g.572539 Transcript_178609/m.572539 type:complete len:440 (+) Transcript_178609:1020-2339(+)
MSRARTFEGAAHIQEIRAGPLPAEILLQLRMRLRLRRGEGVRVHMLASTAALDPQGRLAEEPEQAAAKRPNVTLAGRAASEHLRGHYGNRAGRRGSAVRVRLVGGKELGKAHVDDDGLGRVHGAEHDVIQFEVPMHHTLAVAVRDTLADLVEDCPHPVFSERRVVQVRVFDSLAQVATWQVVCDKVQSLAICIIFEHPQHRRMIQGLQLIDLLHDLLGSQAVRLRQLFVYALQHTSCLRLIAQQFPHHAEGALPEHIANFIVVPGVAKADAQEHVAVEGCGLLVVQLRQQHLTVDLVEFVLAEGAIRVGVKPPHAARHLPVAEVPDAELVVQIAHALGKLVVAQHAVVVPVNFPEPLRGELLQLPLVGKCLRRACASLRGWPKLMHLALDHLDPLGPGAQLPHRARSSAHTPADGHHRPRGGRKPARAGLSPSGRPRKK